MSTFEPETLVRRDIARMEAYTPIVPFDILSERLGRPAAEITKLDANENPYGPAPAALAALAAGTWYHIYPDPEATGLRRALSEHLAVPEECILAGMGADELIDLVLRALLSRGDTVIDCPPTFGMYTFSTSVNGGRAAIVPRRADFALDLPAIVAAAKQKPRPKAIFVCSPNNPDGSLIAAQELRQLLALPLLVVLDEAYIEFAEVGGASSFVSWTQEHDNLVVLRTFSKCAGLAGLRVGYGVFPSWLLPHLWKIKQPYNVNVAASSAACAALQDKAWMLETAGLIVNERQRLVHELSRFAFLEPYPSQANFVLFQVRGRPARALKEDLARQGVLVRYFDKPGLRNCIRITAGTPAETDRLVEALEQCP